MADLNEIQEAFNEEPEFTVSLCTVGIPPEKISVKPGMTVGELREQLDLPTNCKIVCKTGSEKATKATDDTVITAGMELYKETSKDNG